MSTTHSNLNLRRCSALTLVLFCLCAVETQAAPPHGPPPIPSMEELATLPALSAEQQAQLHRILVERRDAHEVLAKRSRDLLDAQRDKDRNEHERIDEQGSERVRKLLGEEGFRRYAEWQLAHRGPGRGEPPASIDRPQGAPLPGERPPAADADGSS
jgi:hypothetical protein